MNKKKFVILFLMFLAVICLIKPIFASNEKRITQKVEDIASIVQGYTNIVGMEDPDELVLIDFEDEVLYNLIKNKYKSKINSYDDETYQIEITNADLATITSLSLPGSDDEAKQIANIEGIQKFKYLTKLSLSKNKITDIDPIKELTELQVLDLSENVTLKDITYFLKTANLNYLKELNITNTRNK